MNVVDVPINSIRPADWRANHVLKPDMKLLSQSMMTFGWTAPLVVREQDSRIIDGYHRWLIAQTDREFGRKHGAKTVPVVFYDIDSIDAMVMHIVLNRSRGQLVARRLSPLVRNILKTKKYSEADMRRILTMSRDEIATLLDGTLFKQRKIDEYEYSKAWVPIEVPAGKTIENVKIELPPNADR